MGLKLFGKNIIQSYKHHIMSIDHAIIDDTTGNDESRYVLRPIDSDRMEEELKPIGTTVTVKNLRKLLHRNQSLVEGFVFVDGDGCSLGTIWVMYRGGNDLEYRIRETDAYIFDVYINETHRGAGLAGRMIRSLMDHLYDKGIERACLAVSLKNTSAIRAYEKVGFKTVCDKWFIRAFKLNIPYHKL